MWLSEVRARIGERHRASGGDEMDEVDVERAPVCKICLRPHCSCQYERKWRQRMKEVGVR